MSTTIAVDLAKSVFQVVVAHDEWKPAESHRLIHSQFECFFNNRAVSLVIMEACGSAHHNKAACALANKLARICYSVLRDASTYGEPQPRLARKADRASFATAA